MNHERLLALDIGMKRIGVAVSDPLGITAQPKPFIVNNNMVFKKIETLIDELDIKKILIGMPFDTSGGETNKTQEIRLFIETLKKSVHIDIEEIDERFSTVAATKQLDQQGINRKKQRHLIDSQAAAFFLQGYLNQVDNKNEPL